MTHDQAANIIHSALESKHNTVDCKDGCMLKDAVKALLDGYQAAVHHCRLSCAACKHIGTDSCEECWLETFPGHPEKTHRTNWEFIGTEPGKEEA